MASSSRIPGFPVLLRMSMSGRHRRQCTQVRAHSHSNGNHEGRSRRHIVDANLRLLKERMEEIRVKEHLKRCVEAEHGWNYISAGDYKQKQAETTKVFLQEFSQLAAMVGATFGFTILSGSLFIFLFSIFVHLNQ